MTINNEQFYEFAVGFVLRHEGDYSDDVEDPGGETKFGISKVHNPDIDVANLTRKQAIEIYRERYWLRYRCNELHPVWAFAVFEGVVNQSPAAIIRALQETVGATVDGIIGPQTVGRANASRSEWHLQMFYARRLRRYMVQRHFPRFGNGWMARVLDSYAHAAQLM